jgi:hypothetical protein
MIYQWNVYVSRQVHRILNEIYVKKTIPDCGFRIIKQISMKLLFKTKSRSATKMEDGTRRLVAVSTASANELCRQSVAFTLVFILFSEILHSTEVDLFRYVHVSASVQKFSRQWPEVIFISSEDPSISWTFC